MAHEYDLQAHRCVSGRRRLSPLLVRIVRATRRPLIPYFAIAFAVAFGFHELERRTDRQLARAIRYSCEHGNAVRREVNSELAKVAVDNPRIKGLDTIYLRTTNCDNLPH